jgi:serine/threonine protein kinase
MMQLLDILKQLHAHEPPVIHRDIKPSNILLKALGGDDYEVYLIDFGAVANPQVQGGGSTVAGTFGYMAPEQLTGKPCPASDIYSLAAVAVYLISGRSPADMPMKDFSSLYLYAL